ncbi:TetR family transcriptional regulator [Nocardia sp. NPDC003482]
MTAKRPPAAPISERQVARRERILDAAAEFGASTEFDRLQMTDIAKAADVAIATLYRYFPSKTHLFAALFDNRIARFVDQEWAVTDRGPISDIGSNLAALNRSLLREPRLCSAMLRATAAGYMKDLPAETLWPGSETALTRAILDTLEIADESVIALLVYSWWGILASSLSRRISPERAEHDLRLAATLILAGHEPEHP